MVQRLIFKVVPGIALIVPLCLAGPNILVTVAADVRCSEIKR